MKYKSELRSEVNPSRISIAASELCSTIRLIENSRNDEVSFYKYVAYAKELQNALYNIEVDLKRVIRTMKP